MHLVGLNLELETGDRQYIYLVPVCMFGLVGLCAYVHINSLFSTSPIEIENLLSVVYYFKNLPPVWYSMFSELYRQSNCLFKIINLMCESPLAPKYFLLSFNSIPHPPGSTKAGTAVVLVVCFSKSVLVLRHVHVCSRISGLASVRLLELDRCMSSACRMPSTAVQYSIVQVHAQCA